jgi:FMN phosphatase YigB (HAD superfamily)
VTTYENSRRCKPNPDYYREVLAALGKAPENCIMVGNDVDEDILPAREVGMKTFLLTHSLLNRKGRDLCGIEQGGFSELKEFLLKNL